MWWRWFPWKQLISRAARARGFVDPVKLLSRLERFAQPIEVKEPLELLRAGMVLHARGLLNTGAIQHNKDWIWPFWVERQFNPMDDAFIPRAFSLTHINLTHRNWTAVGIPDFDELPIVDPRGLLTPFWDGWSVDVWMADESGRRIFPSRMEAVEQSLDVRGGLAVVTRFSREDWTLSSRIEVDDKDGGPSCRMTASARSDEDAWMAVVLRPYNPEGVSFVHDIRKESDGPGWRIGRHGVVRFDTRPGHTLLSNYQSGDLNARLFVPDNRMGIHCRVGMATAAALFPVQGGVGKTVRVGIPLEKKPRRAAGKPRAGMPAWEEALDGCPVLRVPDRRFTYLYEAAVRSVVLHSQADVFPGPYTYKRFWFRDSAFILHALLVLGLADRAERVLDRYPDRQTRAGYFLSQEGEWDSNGEALWIMGRYCVLAGRAPNPGWRKAIERGARWIADKRLPPGNEEPIAGLLPPGFSAEHLGPNDYYYWDDFWGVAGLRTASWVLEAMGETRAASRFLRESDRFLECIEDSLAHAASRLDRPGMPASPYRRMDSGAVGSLVAGYPLQIFSPRDPRLIDTAEYLLSRCLVNGGFYQDIIHSGINPYLTLHLAQVLLRAGDPRARDLLRATAEIASPTGQWPEAVHVRTGGGCMGDGHHVWASAEWILMARNIFLREEEDRLILGAGLLPAWLDQPETVSFGPAPTEFGEVSVSVVPRGETAEVRWTGAWRGSPPEIEVRLPGFAPRDAGGDEGAVLLSREEDR